MDMGFFDLFRNKNKKTVPEEKLSDESLSLSMSLSMSKGTIQEEDSRPDDPEAGITKDRDSITNEETLMRRLSGERKFWIPTR